MHFIYTVLTILAITAAVGWINYRILALLFPCYRQRRIGGLYFIITVASIVVMAYGWSRRPPLIVPDHRFYTVLVYGALIWLCGQFILLVFQPFIAVVHKLTRRCRHVTNTQNSTQTSGISRRTFLQSTLGIAPLLLSVGISTRGIYEAETEMAIQRHFIRLPNLPATLNGFKIGQISDTHLGPYVDLKRFDTAVRALAQEKPDLVAVTGDFADDLSLLRPAIARLNEFSSSVPHGIYFCFGNHDYFHNIGLIRAELNKSKITLLENQNKLIVSGHHPFYLLGVDYPWADLAHNGISISADTRKRFFALADKNIPEQAFKILIGHHPDCLFDGFAAKIPLTLTGHTHGGQVVIGGRSLLSPYTYMRGLYRNNGVYGYVSSGAGQWFPFRLGCPPEVSVFTLVSA
jgi:predicted MPP superfamily phosphohydrolase